MLTECSIYPYTPQLAALPFRLTGMGSSNYQEHIKRSDGYMWHQLLFCVNGYGTLEYDDKKLPIAPNSLIFLPKNCPHEYYPKNDKWGVLWIAFDGGFCDETLQLLGLTENGIANISNPGEILRLYEKIFASQANDILFSGYTCSGLVYEIVLAFRSLITTEADRIKSKHLSKILPAVQYMEANYNRDISIAELAEIVHVTPQHFCRLFKNTFDMRPVEYLLKIRMNAAFKLLDEHVSIAETARRCGFNTPGYFSTVFRKYTGNSPTTHSRPN